MNVVETVTVLIKNWPTLYPNRATALKHVFTSPRWQWVDGELVPESDHEIVRDESLSPLHDEVKGDLDEQLRTSKRNAIVDWTVANAELLAQDTMSSPEHNCLWLPDSYNRFNDMPEDVADDWKAAALDMARTLYHTTREAEKGTHEYNAHRALMPFMRAHNLIREEDVSERIAALEKELAALRGE